MFPSSIQVYDNESTDGTFEWLKSTSLMTINQSSGTETRRE